MTWFIGYFLGTSADFLWDSDRFVPFFFYNDVTRFWKTLCLNYEAYQKAGNHPAMRLDHLKLVYARKLTCFSMIAPLVSRATISPTDVQAVQKLTPLERLDLAIEIARDGEVHDRQVTAASAHVEKLKQGYSEFLQLSEGCRGKSGEDSPLSDNSAWESAKDGSRDFGRALVELFLALGGADALATIAL